tara:strand:+ start:3040 stop:3285 length:246 start_codon:yes stop_codon:yes gene_type:complete
MVRVIFFSVLRELAGVEEVEISMSCGETQVSDILRQVYHDYPRIESWNTKLLIAINGEFADRNELLGDGDELALMPPVQGG